MLVEAEAMWHRPLLAGRLVYGGPSGPTRVAFDVQRVVVLGPVRFEPSMVRVRTADGRVHRALRDDVKPAR